MLAEFDLALELGEVIAILAPSGPESALINDKNLTVDVALALSVKCGTFSMCRTSLRRIAGRL